MNAAMDLEPLYWVNFALVLIVGLVAWFLKRLIYSLDEMMKKVHQLEIDVAIMISKDRHRRLHDYFSQGPP